MFKNGKMEGIARMQINFPIIWPGLNSDKIKVYIQLYKGNWFRKGNPIDLYDSVCGFFVSC